MGSRTTGRRSLTPALFQSVVRRKSSTCQRTALTLGLWTMASQLIRTLILGIGLRLMVELMLKRFSSLAIYLEGTLHGTNRSLTSTSTWSVLRGDLKMMELEI